MLNVIRPGSTVTIGGDIEGTVVQLSIAASDHVQYQVEWWDAKTRRIEWLEAFAVEASEPRDRVAIGFQAKECP